MHQADGHGADKAWRTSIQLAAQRLCERFDKDWRFTKGDPARASGVQYDDSACGPATSDPYALFGPKLTQCSRRPDAEWHWQILVPQYVQ
jgi:hypothetical protein